MPPQLIETTLGALPVSWTAFETASTKPWAVLARSRRRSWLLALAARDLDIERDLAVFVGARNRAVGRTVNGDRDDLRRGQPHRLESGGDIGLEKPSAELDQCDALSLAREARRKVIQSATALGKNDEPPEGELNGLELG